MLPSERKAFWEYYGCGCLYLAMHDLLGGNERNKNLDKRNKTKSR